MDKLFIVIVEDAEDKVIFQMALLGGTIYQNLLSYDDEAKLKRALEHAKTTTLPRNLWMRI